MPRRPRRILTIIPPLLLLTGATAVAAEVNRIVTNTRVCEAHLLSLGRAQDSWRFDGRQISWHFWDRRGQLEDWLTAGGRRGLPVPKEYLHPNEDLNKSISLLKAAGVQLPAALAAPATEIQAACPITGSSYQVDISYPVIDQQLTRFYCPGCDEQRKRLRMRPAAFQQRAIACFATALPPSRTVRLQRETTPAAGQR